MSVFDNLSQDVVNNADTSFPLLAPGLYEFKISNMESKDTQPTEKTPQGGEMISVNCQLQGEAEAIDGRTCRSGTPVRYMIWAPKDPTPEQEEELARKVAAFLDAVVGKTREWDPTFQLYIGKTFAARTKVTPARVNEQTGEEYDPQAEISSFVAKS